MLNSSEPILNNERKTKNATIHDTVYKAKNGNQVLKFNTATISSVQSYFFATTTLRLNTHAWPLPDSDAPYSGIGIVELAVVAAKILPQWNSTLEPVAQTTSDCQYWRYGIGDHD